jgi:hypothetical protein
MVSQRRVSALVGVLFAISVVNAGRLDGHPLHSSYAEITRERNGTVDIQVRLFADDFGALLDSLRRSSGVQLLESVARQYVQRQLVLTMPNGTSIPMTWCGMRSDQNVIWVCVRSATAITGAFRVRNALMFDRFSDQISIIRWAGKKETRTLVLSARVPEARLD